VTAALVLVDHWWSRTGIRLSAMDPPGRLLAAAVATLPDHRREWGMAMHAELAEVLGGSARWQFALSSARAVLRLPLLGGWPALTLVTGVVAAAVAAAAPAVEAVPGLGVFAVSLVGLVGAMVVLAVARSRRMRLPVPAATVLVTGGVATAITMTVIFLLRDPAAARYLPPANAVFLAAVLAGCVWIAVAAPRSLSSNRLAPHLGGPAGGPVVLVRADRRPSSSQRSRPGRPGGRSGRACRPASGRASPPCRSPTPFGCTRRCACTRSTAGCCGSSAALPKART